MCVCVKKMIVGPIRTNCYIVYKKEKNEAVLIDPGDEAFRIEMKLKELNLNPVAILLTHGHYDHFSEEDIKKIKNDDTIIVAPMDLYNRIIEDGFQEKNVIGVEPNNTYEADGIKFDTIPSYNVDKPFHPKENKWVGYIVNIKGERYYIAGDTDINEDDKKVKCDIAFVPVGGTYTMTHKEAAKLVNTIQPKIAVPIHYGSIAGTKEDAKKFVRELKPNIQGIILMK